MITFKNVTKVYNPKKGNKKTALQNISFDLPNKGLIFLLGKSGSGKSTLLNILGTLDKPTDGNILINGKDITKFREKELTSYRSTHIGFVFQEFNLLEDLNVYDNISLALDLKKIKSNKELLDKYLNLVGLDGLGLRKASELSGGEKQRVTIARALIKNPTIILADEPTGNLDSKNSEQIFNILKKISENRLVVVVSHDRENAYKYSDGIIELEDGKIITNTVNIENEESNNLNIDKSHISLLKRLKLAFGMLKNKKIRLAVIIILLTIAFSLFGFSYSLMQFDIPRTHAESMVYEGENEVIIKKYTNNFSINKLITETELEEITLKINSDYNVTSYLYANNNESKINFEENSKYGYLFNNVYFEYFGGIPRFIKYSNEELKTLDILGNIPSSANEVLISEFLADNILHKTFEEYKVSKETNVLHAPQSIENIEELIGKKMWLGNTYVIITGIIKDDELNKYQELKNETIYKMEKKPTKLYLEFKSKYANNIYDLIVSEEYFEKTKFLENNYIDSRLFKTVTLFNEEEFYKDSSFAILDEKIKIYNGTKIIEKENLQENEIIISFLLLDEMLNYEPSTKIKEAWIRAREEYDKKVKDRNQKVIEQQNALLNNPDYVVVDIPEIPLPDYEGISDQIYLEIFEEKVLGKNLTLEFIDNFGLTQTKSSKYNLLITGLSLSEEIMYSYLPNSFKKYEIPNMVVSSINIKENNKEVLEQLFRDFEGNEYKVETRFSSYMNTISKIVKSIEKIAKYITIGFLMFAVILFTMFTTSNLNVNKKKIGILRALGAKTKDIIKIFLLESSLIGLFTFVLASIGTIISINMANNYITKELFFYARPIIFNYESIIGMFIVVIIVIIISSIVPIIKLSRMKPIDLINDK